MSVYYTFCHFQKGEKSLQEVSTVLQKAPSLQAHLEKAAELSQGAPAAGDPRKPHMKHVLLTAAVAPGPVAVAHASYSATSKRQGRVMSLEGGMKLHRHVRNLSPSATRQMWRVPVSSLEASVSPKNSLLNPELGAVSSYD